MTAEPEAVHPISGMATADNDRMKAGHWNSNRKSCPVAVDEAGQVAKAEGHLGETGRLGLIVEADAHKPVATPCGMTDNWRA